MTEIRDNPQTPPDPSMDDDALYHELVGQTAKADWEELERFFAKGQIVKVDGAIDLVDVAMAMVRDRAERFKTWQEAGQVAPLDTDTARRWAGGEATLWAVVTPPWILVQEADSAPARH
ncbi:DUF2288 domain-containing protein [Guyparkeria sp.]|uniref:DUF2288 domain-containing protein n=1 Tax=Guyparkeria sp. TaxID=2035736 RepID=UPI003562BADD